MDTYTLKISLVAESKAVANNVKIESIPANPYVVQVTQEGQIIITTSGVPIPEFPSIFLPAIMIISFLGAVMLIQRTREHRPYRLSKQHQTGSFSIL